MRPESPEKEKAELRGRKLIGATLEVEVERARASNQLGDKRQREHKQWGG